MGFRFDILGVFNFKSQVEESPVVSSNTDTENQVTNKDDTEFNGVLNNNIAVLKEFSDIIPTTTKSFSDMNDIVSTTNRSLAEFRRIIMSDNGNNTYRQKNNRNEPIVTENKTISQSLLDENIQSSPDYLQENTGFTPDYSQNNNNSNSQYGENNVYDNLSQETNIDLEKQKDIESEQRYNEIQEEYSEGIKNSTVAFKELNDFLPEMLKSFRAMNDIVNRTNQNLPALGHVKTKEEQKKALIEGYHKQNFLQLVNGGSNAMQSFAGGNVGGGLLSGVNTVSNLANNASKMAGAEDLTGLAKGLAVGGVAALAVGAIGKGVDSLANKYIEEMPTMYNAGRAFDTTSDNRSMINYQKLNEYNKGTGLENDAFVSLASSLRQQGVANDEKDSSKQVDIVGKIAETTSRWAYATGGNAEQYANLAGLMSRYGGSKDVESDFNYLVSAGKASGLNNTQIPEFLSGIQKVMEDGISKGFTRSATDVADTLVMMSKLSGNNEFFKGEQGARLINQVNNGISRATSLSKTEDILVYSAFDKAYSPEKQKEKLEETGQYVEGAQYVNTMQMIERGLKADNVGVLMDYINNNYGTEDEKIEALRNMTGLNYSGASLFYNSITKAQKEDIKLSDEDIEKITKAPENQNNETNYKQALNDIKTSVVNMSEKLGDLKIKGMDAVARDVKRIADKVGGVEKRQEKEKIIENEEKRKDEGKKIVSDLTDLQKSELVDNGVYQIKDASARQAAINGYLDWNGIGMPDNWNSNKVYSDYENGQLKTKLHGWTQQDNYAFTNSTYGNYILGLANGDEEKAKSFMHSLIYKGDSKEEKKIYKEGEKYRDKMISTANNDKVITEQEKAETVEILKKIYNMFANGITVTEHSSVKF